MVGYDLEGRYLESCNCKAICPCWAGGDPDKGTCDAVLSWHIDRGKVNDVDVSGLTLVALAHVPGNIFKGNWRLVVYVDDKATPQQQEALVNVWTGKLGGPVADLVPLIGEVAGLERAPITFALKDGKGTLRVGEAIAIDQAAFLGPQGRALTLHDPVFSPTAGAPITMGKASSYRVNAPQYGFQINLQGHNASQGGFHFEG